MIVTEEDGRFDPASFRDPDARVSIRDGRVLRIFTANGAERFRSFVETGLLDRFIAQGHVIPASPLSQDDIPDSPFSVEHPRIPFLSYAYEWSFGMLREAALLELDLVREALEQGFILKDATPYNVQFFGFRPVHIDVASFEPWKEGSPWRAYAQFCRLFLNPLLLTSMTGLPFHPFLRGRLDGITPEEIARVLPWHCKLRPSLFLNVSLQAWLNRTFQESAAAPKDGSIRKKHLIRLLERLRTLVNGLKPRQRSSPWTRYEGKHRYNPEAQNYKEQFVERALKRSSPQHVWDLGCNTGHYAILASRHAREVVAIDRDPAAIGLLYESTQREQRENILCLVMDLLDPSVDQGWNGEERQGLARRARPDFCLCLALIHHVAIAGGVPLGRLIRWLANTTPAGVIEFVPKEDPGVHRLLQWRDDRFDHYHQTAFEAEMGKHFQIVERGTIPGTLRTLYAFSR